MRLPTMWDLGCYKVMLMSGAGRKKAHRIQWVDGLRRWLEEGILDAAACRSLAPWITTLANAT